MKTADEKDKTAMKNEQKEENEKTKTYETSYPYVLQSCLRTGRIEDLLFGDYSLFHAGEIRQYNKII